MHLAVALAVALAWHGPGAEPRVVDAPAPHTRLAAQSFVPPLAQVDQLRVVSATASIPTQLVVTWRATAPDSTERGGLSIWQRAGRARWRRIYRIRRPPNLPRPGFFAADVTRDGHLDLLLLMSNGSAHVCGPERLLALERGRARSIWSSEGACADLTLTHLAGHDLVVDRPDGIADSIWSPAFIRHRVLRWDGMRMRAVVDERFTHCVFGGTYCGSPPSRRPVRLLLHDVRWWDSRRGVATARDGNSAHLELLVTTADGGRTWTYILPTFLRLGAPRLGPGGRVTVVGRRCRPRCVPSHVFRAERFGWLWTHAPLHR
jgi:hypothetical protein